MYAAETIAWVLAALLVCWGATVAGRGLAGDRVVATGRRAVERHARPNGRLLVLGLLVLGAGAGVGLWAVRLRAQLGLPWNNEGPTPLHVAAGVVGAFALGLGVWAWLGQPARGRKRCPRCWFSMDGAPVRRCPECGHEAADDAALLKPRRRRWALRLAACMVLAAASLGVVGRSAWSYGWFGLVPTPVLVAGMRVLPEDWIVESTKTGSLYERLRDANDDGSVRRWTVRRAWATMRPGVALPDRARALSLLRFESAPAEGRPPISAVRSEMFWRTIAEVHTSGAFVMSFYPVWADGDGPHAAAALTEEERLAILDALMSGRRGSYAFVLADRVRAGITDASERLLSAAIARASGAAGGEVSLPEAVEVGRLAATDPAAWETIRSRWERGELVAPLPASGRVLLFAVQNTSNRVDLRTLPDGDGVLESVRALVLAPGAGLDRARDIVVCQAACNEDLLADCLQRFGRPGPGRAEWVPSQIVLDHERTLRWIERLMAFRDDPDADVQGALLWLLEQMTDSSRDRALSAALLDAYGPWIDELAASPGRLPLGSSLWPLIIRLEDRRAELAADAAE